MNLPHSHLIMNYGNGATGSYLSAFMGFIRMAWRATHATGEIVASIPVMRSDVAASDVGTPSVPMHF
jgi:hypothetical protein